MVEINNQRKAFLDMLAWSEGIDNGRQKTRNHGYDVIVGGELFTDYLDHPRKLVTPPTQPTGAGRYQLLSCWWDAPTGCQAYSRKISLRKVRTLWHCSRLRSVALYLWLIVVISVRQSTVAAISGLHCLLVESQWAQGRQPDCKIQKKRAERSERLMYEQSHRDYLRSGYLHHRLPVMGLLIITVITPLPTKPSATKMPENWSWRTRQLLTCRCASAWCCCARCKIHEGVSWC